MQQAAYSLCTGFLACYEINIILFDIIREKGIASDISAYDLQRSI